MPELLHQIKGELVIEGDNLKSLLDVDQAQQNDFLIEVPLDNGRWELEIAWGPGYSMKPKADPQASSASSAGLTSPPPSLSIYLYSFRDEDERRAGRMLRHAGWSLKVAKAIYRPYSRPFSPTYPSAQDPGHRY